MGGLGPVLGDLGAVWGGLGAVLGDLGAIFGLGAFLDSLWAVLGRLGAVMGGSWGFQGRSKIDQTIDPKLDSKTGRIATGKNGPNSTPVDFSELEKTQRNLDNATPKNYQNRYRYD